MQPAARRTHLGTDDGSRRGDLQHRNERDAGDDGDHRETAETSAPRHARSGQRGLEADERGDAERGGRLAPHGEHRREDREHEPARCVAGAELRVAERRRAHEQHGEQPLPLAEPRDGLGVRGVECPQKEREAGDRAVDAESLERPEPHEDRRDVEHDVGQVKAAVPAPPDRDVEHHRRIADGQILGCLRERSVRSEIEEHRVQR